MPGQSTRAGEYKRIALLVLIPTLIYAYSLTGEFVYDDIAITVVENPALSGEASLWEVLSWDRPLREFTYMLDHAIWGYDPTGYHLQSLLWHIFNTLLIYFFFCYLGISSKVSFAASMLFSIHPINTESVAWISGRKELLCLFFELAACLLFLHAVMIETRGKRWRILLYCASLFAFILALLSKQVAVALPFLLAVCSLYYTQNYQHPSWGIIGKALLPFFLVLLISLFLRFDILGTLDTVQDRAAFYDPASRDVEYTALSAFLTPFATFAKSIWLLVFPWDLTVEHAFPPVTEFADFRWILGALLMLSIVVFSLWQWRRRPVFLFAFAWFLITWALLSGAVPIAYLLADRYLYIPSLAFCLFAVEGGILVWDKLSSIAERPAWTQWVPHVVMILICALFSLRTFVRTLDWQSEIHLWKSAITARPQYANLYYKLGNAYFRENDFPHAYANWKMALSRDPDIPQAWLNMGNALEKEGKQKDAEEAYRKAIELFPEYGAAHYNLALLLELDDRVDEALHHLRIAVETLYGKQSTPRRVGLAHYQLARILFTQGNLKEARAHAQQAEHLHPQYPKIHILKGLLYADDLQTARRAFKAAIELDPDSAEAYFNLGLLEWQKGDPDLAMSYWKNATNLNPDFQSRIDQIIGTTR